MDENKLNDLARDEIFIILNDFKRIFSSPDEELNLYDKNEFRMKILNSIDLNNLPGYDLSENEMKLMKYCKIVVEMIDRIIKKVSDEDRVMIKKQILFCIHEFHDTNKFLNEFFNIVINEMIKSTETANITYSQVSCKKYLKLLNKLFVPLIGNSTKQSIQMETYIFIKSLVVLSKFDGPNDYIDSEIIEIPFNPEINKIFSNSILCHIYLRNLDCKWFNRNKFDKFLNENGGNLMKEMGNYMLRKDKFNEMYAIGLMIYSEIMNDERNAKMKSNEITNDMLKQNNGAISINVENSKYLVVELHEFNVEDMKNVNNTNNTLKSNDSYIIYDINCNNKFNIRNIAYSLNELIEYINEFNMNPISNFTSIDIITIRQNNSIHKSYKNVLLYFIILILIISICIIITSSTNPSDSPRITIFDKNL